MESSTVFTKLNNKEVYGNVYDTSLKIGWNSYQKNQWIQMWKKFNNT